MNDRFRVGRTVGRTIYRQVGDDPSKGDELIGLMDTRELAAFTVAAMNASARIAEARARPNYPDSPEQIAEQAAVTKALTGGYEIERLARIADWHSRDGQPGGMFDDYCTECREPWPCDTRRMADGTYEDPDPPQPSDSLPPSTPPKEDTP